jgi:hypothetical protein
MSTIERSRRITGSQSGCFFGGEGLLLEVHPDEQEKRLKYNHLLTNAVVIQNVIDLTRAVAS